MSSPDLAHHKHPLLLEAASLLSSSPPGDIRQCWSTDLSKHQAQHALCFFWGTILSPAAKPLRHVQYYRWESLKNICNTCPPFPPAKRVPPPLLAVRFQMARLLPKCRETSDMPVCELWPHCSFLSSLTCQRKLEAGSPSGSLHQCQHNILSNWHHPSKKPETNLLPATRCCSWNTLFSVAVGPAHVHDFCRKRSSLEKRKLRGDCDSLQIRKGLLRRERKQLFFVSSVAIKGWA